MPVDEDTKEALTAEAEAKAAQDAAVAEADKAAAKAQDGVTDGDVENTAGLAAEAEAKAAADALAAEADKAKETLDTSKWTSTDDDVGDNVLLLLQTSGVEPDVAKSLLYDAVVAGDPTKIDRDSLVEKVGKVNASLILAGVENFIARNNAKSDAITATVHDAVGGKDNWTKVAEWSGKNIDADKRTELAVMIDAGGAQAKFAATELLNMYNADEKNTSLGSTTRIEGDAKAPDTGRAIDRRTYATELEKAHRNGANPAVIAEIQAARVRGRQRGL